MPKKISQRSFFNFAQIFVLICSFILPNWAIGSVSDLRLKTLIKICEAARLSGDGGTINNIALQLNSIQFDTETDLGKQAVKCIEAGFPSDEKSASFEGMIVKINKLQAELREVCFNLLELKPTQAITFEPCKEFY